MNGRYFNIQNHREGVPHYFHNVNPYPNNNLNGYNNEYYFQEPTNMNMNFPYNYTQREIMNDRNNQLKFDMNKKNTKSISEFSYEPSMKSRNVKKGTNSSIQSSVRRKHKYRDDTTSICNSTITDNSSIYQSEKSKDFLNVKIKGQSSQKNSLCRNTNYSRNENRRRHRNRSIDNDSDDSRYEDTYSTDDFNDESSDDSENYNTKQKYGNNIIRISYNGNVDADFETEEKYNGSEENDGSYNYSEQESYDYTSMDQSNDMNQLKKGKPKKIFMGKHTFTEIKNSLIYPFSSAPNKPRRPISTMMRNQQYYEIYENKGNKNKPKIIVI